MYEIEPAGSWDRQLHKRIDLICRHVGCSWEGLSRSTLLCPVNTVDEERFERAVLVPHPPWTASVGGNGPSRDRGRGLCGDTKRQAVICREEHPGSPGVQVRQFDAGSACTLEYPRRRPPTCAHLQNACQAPCGCPEERRSPPGGPLLYPQCRAFPSGALFFVFPALVTR